ncbi:hypothetical protein RM96_22510 [Cupriavidus sp. IDO]|nr:hypothetical protein RM96_22510 [Cupriavidus sp. IDO]
MTEYVPERATSELLALEAKLSAQMPYRQVVSMMREFLPVRKTLNHVAMQVGRYGRVHASRLFSR